MCICIGPISLNELRQLELSRCSICEQQRFRRACTCTVSPEPILFAHVSAVFAKSFLLMQDSCQTELSFAGQISICRTEDIFVVRILFSLLKSTSDRLKVFAGQNENMQVLPDSPALFAKTVSGRPRGNFSQSTKHVALLLRGGT